MGEKRGLTPSTQKFASAMIMQFQRGKGIVPKKKKTDEKRIRKLDVGLSMGKENGKKPEKEVRRTRACWDEGKGVHKKKEDEPLYRFRHPRKKRLGRKSDGANLTIPPFQQKTSFD